MGDDWVPFSHRYGIARYARTLHWDAGRWRSRHSDDIVATKDEPDVRFRCVCLSSPGRSRCAIRASQEDRLCDACREHCVAVDETKRYHRLVDIYGAAT